MRSEVTYTGEDTEDIKCGELMSVLDIVGNEEGNRWYLCFAYDKPGTGIRFMAWIHDDFLRGALK